MNIPSSLFILLLVTASLQADDWPAWRGPTADGHAASGQKVPVKWSESENVLWKTEVRGRGHGSPTVVGDRIYLASADVPNEEQIVICFDRATGKQVWETIVHSGNFVTGGHRNSSLASGDVVCDGERLYVNFLNDSAVFTSALDLSGKVLWQRRVCDFKLHQGYGASPVIHQNVVLVAADHRGGGKFSGLNKLTGEILWQQDRPPIANYATPAVVNAAGKTQAVLGGCNLVSSFDPLTGKKLWEIEGSTEETVVTAVTDGSGRIAWENNTRSYVPSLLVKNGHVFGVGDSGKAMCWKSDTGEELWSEKVDKEFYGSPVMLDNRIYITSKAGVTSVFEATSEKFTLLSQNQLGDESFSTPAICGNRIYLRSAKLGQSRQEYLWCVGE